MTIKNPEKYLKTAQRKNKAIAAFNVYNMEMIQSVINGAKKENAPIIIQTTPGTIRYAGAKMIAKMLEIEASKNNVNAILHLDHCKDFDIIMEALKAGYSSVMFDGSNLSFNENVRKTAEIVKISNSIDVKVEAELGKIGGTEDDISVDKNEATLTDPDKAVEFISKTNVDSLAIAIGTAHGQYKGQPKLDFERLEKIKAKTEVPLVLHGASGVSDSNVKTAISYGINKVNIATELKVALANRIRLVLNKDKSINDPRNYFGEGKKAVEKIVRKKINLCGIYNSDIEV